MKHSPLSGLLIGLLLALATAALVAAGSVPPFPSPLPTSTPTLPSTDSPTFRPTDAPTPKPTGTPTPQPTTPPPPRPTSPPTGTPSPTPSPTTQPAGPSTFQTIGYSVENRPITATRIGDGPIKVVLIGDIHGAYEANTYTLTLQLLDYFQAHPQDVPPDISLWLIPTMNPDGLATGHRWNAHKVDLNRNADTDLDGCAGNDWSPDTVGHEGVHKGAGGTYPFSEPEAAALRDFLDDAWIAVFYHSAAEAIFVDSCARHTPTARLAQVLSEATGYPVPEEGWAGYPVTGDWGDYLAGEGVAAVTVELSDHDDPEFERNLAGVQALLTHAQEIVQAEADRAGAEYVWLDEAHVGQWRYAENTFLHPIALEVVGDTAYLLDGGRVLAQPLTRPDPPYPILAPGDDVEGVRVLEPLDLAAAGDTLLTLDRAGDVYRYDPRRDAWSLERYDRPPGETSAHYFVALTGDGQDHYLLETTYEQVVRFADGERGGAWAKLPKSRDVDVSVGDAGVYVLTRAMNNPLGDLRLYRQGGVAAKDFAPGLPLMHPRQVVAAGETVYVLDRAGRRLLALDPRSGALQTLYQFPDRRAVGAVWADPDGGRLLLAGRDTLYFVGQPEQAAEIVGGPQLTLPQPHDPDLLESLRGYAVPIEGAHLTNRDFQMPGAPRHYRLGVHEGIDWYGHTVGVPVDRNTPVHAVADGVVIRALVDYQPLTAAQAEAWRERCRAAGYTPPEVLDGYRGRQVWIDHGGGVVSRYAHLSRIEPGIVEGAQVRRGQIIAYVGNSGTPASVNSRTVEVHLHLELWVGEHFVGQFLRPIEAREWLGKILVH